MSTIIRGARIADVTIQERDCRMNARCDYTEAMREKMDWQELGLTSKLIQLEGELPKGRLVLISQQPDLNGHSPELRLHFDSIAGFRAVRVKGKDQESTSVELRFHIRSDDPNAAALCQAYKSAALKTLGEMRILDEAEEDERPVEANPDQMTIAQGMKIVSDSSAKPKRDKTRGGRAVQISEAAAGVSVEIDPAERAKLDGIIDSSLHN